MSKNRCNKQAGLPEPLIKTIEAAALLRTEGEGGNQDEPQRLAMITYLIMARFSFDQIEAMYSNPPTIVNMVEKHIREMSGDNGCCPGLCGVLRQAASAGARDIFELGVRIGDALPGLIDVKTRESLQSQCRELSGLLDNASKAYHKINIVDFFAFIPILGFPFGIIRSKRLSAAGAEMEKIRELNDALSDTLSALEPNIDLTALEEPNKYKGWYYDYARANLSVGNYISDVLGEIKQLKERVRSIDELLNKMLINK